MTQRIIDYAFKSHVLVNHKELLKKHNLARKKTYALSCFYDSGEYNKIIDDANIQDLGEFFSEARESNLYKEALEAEKINRASKQRVNRLKKRIANMLDEGGCIFVTLTFNDNALTSTSESIRRKGVVEYLKSCSHRYVANIDYGKNNGREHYHAIVLSNSISLQKWRRFGNINVERIRKSNATALSKYISKLTNHAIKETTKRNAIIYSR